MEIKDLKIKERDDVLLLARIAEQSEQYQDMIEILKPLYLSEDKNSKESISVEERNLLSVAYKNAVGLKRIAWRAAKKALSTQKFSSYSKEILDYIKKLEEECVDVCKDYLNLITKVFIPQAKKQKNTESLVYFMKLQGDYFRYVAEVSDGDRKDKGVDRCLKSYNEGIELAEQLPPGDPTRLSLQLNFSIFCFETLDSQKEALEMADQAIEEAEEHIEGVDKSKQGESQTVLQFLKENVTSWKQRVRDQGDDNSKRNLFSQNDSEAQFIEQEPLSDDEDDDDDLN